MTKGSIKRVMKERGYGFIKVEDGREIFVNKSALHGLGFNSLLKGVTVECDVQNDIYNKFKAVNVRRALG